MQAVGGTYDEQSELEVFSSPSDSYSPKNSQAVEGTHDEQNELEAFCSHSASCSPKYSSDVMPSQNGMTKCVMEGSPICRVALHSTRKVGLKIIVLLSTTSY